MDGPFELRLTLMLRAETHEEAVHRGQWLVATYIENECHNLFRLGESHLYSITKKRKQTYHLTFSWTGENTSFSVSEQKKYPTQLMQSCKKRFPSTRASKIMDIFVPEEENENKEVI